MLRVPDVRGFREMAAVSMSVFSWRPTVADGVAPHANRNVGSLFTHRIQCFLASIGFIKTPL